MSSESAKTPKQPDFMETQYAFAAHVRDPEHHPAPEGIEDRRMGIYRELIYNSVRGFLDSAFPVLRKTLTEDEWAGVVRDFLVHHRAQTPYFLEIPKEFLQYINTQHTPALDARPFAAELAHYEWLELALSVDKTDIDMTGIDADGDLLEGRPVVSPLAWLVHYQYPVHRISADFQPTHPGDQPTLLVVVRDRTDEIGFLEVNPVTARLIELLEGDTVSTGRGALETIASELNHPNPQIVIDGGTETLATLKARDIVLGTAGY